jgi:hypothetical protein
MWILLTVYYGATFFPVAQYDSKNACEEAKATLVQQMELDGWSPNVSFYHYCIPGQSRQ